MSSDPTVEPTSPGVVKMPQISQVPTASTEPIVQEEAQPPVQFSGPRWFFTGLVRLSYRLWTRIAVRLFPENSKSEHFARAIGIPLPDKLNMSWVTDSLAVGGRVHPHDIIALARLGITAVVDTRSEYCDDSNAMAREHIELLYLPTPDTYPLSVEQLQQGATWVEERIQKGGRVLIHCEHGVGRSVLLTCAVLVNEGMNAQSALTLVQEKRWQASPNSRQVARLREFADAGSVASGRVRTSSSQAHKA